MRNDPLRVLASPQLWRGPLPWIVALFIAANFAISYWHAALIAEKQKTMMLPETFSDAGNTAIRWDRSAGEHLGEFLKFIPDATRQPLTIVSGMSQMYVINDPKPGDKTIVEWLDDALAPKGARAFGVAAPNLCNEEANFILQKLLETTASKPSTFIFAVCFDKFRNVDLRPGYEDVLRASAPLQARLAQLAERYKDSCPAASEKIKLTLAGLSRVETPSAQAPTFESRVRSEAGQLIPAFEARKDLNASLQIKLNAARNALLGIKNSSKRPILKAHYEQNCQFLEMLAAECKREHVRLILYVIPLNPSAENPYVAAEYEAFKQWIETLASKHGVPFSNFEGLVPAEEWGLLDGEPDYKHFKGAAHKRTADALMERFGGLLTQGNP